MSIILPSTVKTPMPRAFLESISLTTFSAKMMSFWVGVRSHGRWGSDGVDDGFAVEAHQVDVLHVLAEAVHILQVGIDGVEALHACGAGGNDHLLAAPIELDAGAR